MFRLAKSLGTAALINCALLPSFLSPACGQSPYATYNPVYLGPYGGYLYGAAEVIRAQGQFQVHTQQAYSMYQDYQIAKPKVRQARLEQWLWERDNLPTLEDDRRRYHIEQVRRAFYDPPVTEIWSGKSLNDLLKEAMKLKNIGPGKSLNPETLAKINVTSGVGGGNIGLLRGGKVDWWPYLLHRKEFANDCEQIEQLLAQAYREAEQGKQIDAGIMGDLTNRIDGLERQVRALAKDPKVDFMLYKRALQFITQFNAALRVLQEKDGLRFFTGKIVARGNTVGELVKYMREEGLEFAPATGNERDYKAMHSALAAYVGEEGLSNRNSGVKGPGN